MARESDAPDSPYDDDIDRFFDDVTLSLSALTKSVVGHTYDLSKDLWNDRPLKEIDDFFNRPYQSRSAPADGAGPDSRWPWPRRDVLPLVGALSSFGLFAFSTPSQRQYNTCVAKHGLSVWDANGHWRCLFPSSEVPEKFLQKQEKRMQHGLLTKEEFEAEAQKAAAPRDGAIDLGPMGVFFKSYNDLLDWKNKSFEADRARRAEAAAAKSAQRSARRDEWAAVAAEWAAVAAEWKARCDDRKAGRTELRESSGPAPGPDAREAVGSSTSTFTTAGSDEVVEKETRTQYFSDGSSVTNTVTRKKPAGAETWASVEEHTDHGEGKHGWFWK